MPQFADDGVYLANVIELRDKTNNVRTILRGQPGFPEGLSFEVFGSAAPDLSPDAFAFANQSGAELSTAIESNIITVSGLSAGATGVPARVMGDPSCRLVTSRGQIAVGGSTNVNNGDTAFVRVSSSANPLTLTRCSVSISDASDEWDVTTRDRDTTPNFFTFDDQTDVAKSSLIDSNEIVVSGITDETPIVVAGSSGSQSEYRINGGAYTSIDGLVRNGDLVMVRHRSASEAATQTDTMLSIGGVSDVFSSTTEDPDITPDAFSFADLIDVELGTQQLSNSIRITGITGSAPISIVGGEYTLDGIVWTTSDSTVTDGTMVRLRHASSTDFSTATDTTLTVGADGVLAGVSDTFTSTTLARDITPDPFDFVDLFDVGRVAPQISNAIIVSGTNTAAPISVSGGAYSINGGPFVSGSGTVQAGGSVRVRHNSSDAFSTSVTTTLDIGGVTASFSSTTRIVDGLAFTVAGQNAAEASGTVTVTMQLPAASGLPVSVPLSFNGSASRPGDYSTSSTGISISPGSLSGRVTLSIVADTAFESNETIIVTAGSPSNATLGSPGVHVVTLVDDDAQAVATITVTPASASLPTVNQHCVTATTRDSVGTVLSGVPLGFAVTGANPTTGSGFTNVSGAAQFCFTGVNAGTDSIKASFMSLMGTASITWTKRNTVLKADPVPAVIVTQGLQVLIRLSPRATLRDVTTNTPIAGRTVNFTAGTTGSAALCTAVTNASGVATCQATVANSLRTTLALAYTARFNGDTTYNPSSGKGDVLGLTLF